MKIGDAVEQSGSVNACAMVRRCGQHAAGKPFAMLRCKNVVVDGNRPAIRGEHVATCLREPQPERDGI